MIGFSCMTHQFFKHTYNIENNFTQDSILHGSMYFILWSSTSWSRIWLPSPYGLPIEIAAYITCTFAKESLYSLKCLWNDVLWFGLSSECLASIVWIAETTNNFTFTLLWIIDVQGWDWEHLVHKQHAHLFCYNDSSHFFQGRLNICL